MPRSKHPEETKKKILDAAMVLFREKGYEDVTVLDIIAGTGDLTRGAFYHHFKNKDEVIEAIFDRRWDSENPWASIAARKDLNGLEKLKHLLKTGVQSNTSTDYNKAVVTLALEVLDSPRFFMEHHKGNLIQAKFVEPFIAEGMADGSIPPGNAKALSELMFLLLNFWMLPNIYPGTFEEVFARGEIVDKIFDMLGLNVIDSEIEEAFAETIGFIEEVQCEKNLPAE